MLAEDFEEAFARQVEAGIGRHGLDDDGGNLAALRHEERAQRGHVVEGQRDREFGECFRHAGAVRLPVGERAAAGFHEERVHVAVVAALEFHNQIAP